MRAVVLETVAAFRLFPCQRAKLLVLRVEHLQLGVGVQQLPRVAVAPDGGQRQCAHTAAYLQFRAGDASESGVGSIGLVLAVLVGQVDGGIDPQWLTQLVELVVRQVKRRQLRRMLQECCGVARQLVLAQIESRQRGQVERIVCRQRAANLPALKIDGHDATVGVERYAAPLAALDGVGRGVPRMVLPVGAAEIVVERLQRGIVIVVDGVVLGRILIEDGGRPGVAGLCADAQVVGAFARGCRKVNIVYLHGSAGGNGDRCALAVAGVVVPEILCIADGLACHDNAAQQRRRPAVSGLHADAQEVDTLRQLRSGMGDIAQRQFFSGGDGKGQGFPVARVTVEEILRPVDHGGVARRTDIDPVQQRRAIVDMLTGYATGTQSHDVVACRHTRSRQSELAVAIGIGSGCGL